MRRRETEQAVRLEEVSQQHKRDIADKVAVFWREVGLHLLHKAYIIIGSEK